MGALVEDLGYNIVGVWGTFASIRDYKSELGNWTYYYKGENKALTCDLRPLFEVMSEYYDTNLLSNFFAPAFPANSRNCLWHLRKKQGDDAAQKRMFSALSMAPEPWTSHPDWRDLAG
jgi:hypothetical protein